MQGVVEVVGKPIKNSLPRVLGGRDRQGKDSNINILCYFQLPRGQRRASVEMGAGLKVFTSNFFSQDVESTLWIKMWTLEFFRQLRREEEQFSSESFLGGRGLLDNRTPI